MRPSTSHVQDGRPEGVDARRVALALVLGIVLLGVTNRISDLDVWQHLQVGRVLWQQHAIPRTNLWTWPSYGTRYDIPSWLFCALLWPAWSALGERGLDLWRWITALGLFLVMFASARRACRPGLAGVASLAVLGWSALLWRQRWGCRPETLAAILMALEIWILEARRRAPPRPIRRDIAWWLIPLQVVWINVHLTYFLGLLVGVAYLLDDLWRAARKSEGAPPWRLALVLPCAAIACTINPFGISAMWQPFDFMLHGRTELVFSVVDELRPIDWSNNLRNGLPLFLVATLALAIRRWRERGFDPAQAFLIAATLPEALVANRFLLFFVVGVAPFLARDAEAAFDAIRIRGSAASPSARVAIAMPAVVLLAALEFTRVAPPFGFGVRWDRVPVSACDYLASRHIQGRGYNMFWHGGYLLWRFWPDRDLRPFMDIHQTGSRTDRDMQVLTQVDWGAWNRLDTHYRFDWVLLPTRQAPATHLLDQLEADSTTWALAFVDDAGSVFLRRDGADAGQARRDGYPRLRLSRSSFVRLRQLALADTAFRHGLRPELDRAIQSSSWHSRALSLKASLDLMDSKWDQARDDLESALAISPGLEGGHDRLAYALLMTGDSRGALDEIARARRNGMAAMVADQLTRQARAVSERPR